MENGNNYQGTRGAPDGECCVEKRSTRKGVGEAGNEKEACQVLPEVSQKRRGPGVRKEIEEH
jgi:hypothetical protein